MGSAKSWALAAVGICLAVALSGCMAVPVPAKTRTEGTRGQARLDFRELKTGISTRAQVEHQLESVLVPIESQHMLWARFTKSTSAILWVAGGPGAAAGGGERNWGIRNVFAEFDADGKLTKMREVKDSELHACLREYIRSGEIEMADPATDVVLDVTHRHARSAINEASVKMTISPEEMTLEEMFSAKHSFHLKKSQLKELAPAGGFKRDAKPYAGAVLESLEFVDDAGKEHRFSLYVSPVDLPVLLRFFDRARQSSQKQTRAKTK